MVKSTKKEVDNNQSKISSFFVSEANPNKKLFSSVGSSKLRLPKKKDNGSTIYKLSVTSPLFKDSVNPENPAIPNNSLQTNNNNESNSSTLFTIIQPPCTKNVSQNSIPQSESITHEKTSSSPNKQTNLTKNLNSSSSNVGQDSLNEQPNKTDPKIKSLTLQPLTSKANSESESFVPSASPKFSKSRIHNSVPIIPETPEYKPRKKLSRAFLASSTQLKNTVENKIHQASSVHLLKLKNKAKRVKPNVTYHIKEPTNCLASTKNSIEEHTSLETDSYLPTESTTPVGSLTPVKKYSNGNSVKRLAKNGISPSAKRNILDETCHSNKNCVENNLEKPRVDEEEVDQNFQNGCADLSDNEIEMWEDLSTKGGDVWDDLGLSLIEQDKEDSKSDFYPRNKDMVNQSIDWKTKTDSKTNEKISKPGEDEGEGEVEVDKQKSESVNLMEDQDQIFEQSSNLSKEKNLKPLSHQTIWSFKKSEKKSKSKKNSADDENLLLEILGEINQMPDSKAAQTKTDLKSKAIKTIQPIILNPAASDVMAVSEINPTEDQNLLQEILCEINAGKDQMLASCPEMSIVENGAQNLGLKAEICSKQNEQPFVDDPISKNIIQTDVVNQQPTTVLAKSSERVIETRDANPKNINTFYKPTSSQEAKSYVDEDKISLKEYECLDFSPWDSSFELEDQPPNENVSPAGKNVKHSVDHVLSSSLQKLSPFKPREKCLKTTLPAVKPACTNYNRFQVKNLNHHSNDKIELTLVDGDKVKKCILYGFWCDSRVLPGDVVNVLGVNPDSSGVYHITDQEGLLVINPDLLVSGTSIVATLFCMRKAILNERFKGIDKGNKHMLYGSIIHCLFQEVLLQKLTNEDQLFDVAQNIIRRSVFLKEMYGQEITESAIMEEISKYIPSIITWIKKHTTFTKSLIPAQDPTLVTEIKDIEENIWSPRFGVKGKIDLTVEVKIKNERKKVVPLELKTGKSSFSAEHKGQVTLYSMMSCDRQGDPGKGLLLYLKDQPLMEVIPADQQNKRGLIQLRNELVNYFKNSLNQPQNNFPSDMSFLLGDLPEPISNQRACSKCPHLLNCSLYQRSMSRNHPPRESWSNLLENTLSHLSKTHLDYFVHWCVMIEMENSCQKKGEAIKGIWCSSGIDREINGECLSNLQFLKSEKLPDSEKFLNTFQRHPISVLKQEFSPLDMIGLCSNDSVAVSAESKQQVVLCTGYIYKITTSNVTIISERNLCSEADSGSVIFRIDKCDTYNTWATCYYNLSILMSDNPHCARLRELIIDCKTPQIQTTLPKSLIQKVKKVFKPLNKPQRASVLKVLMSDDYVILRGYPGTGKTSTIVALIKVLTKLGLSILLASYTHSAVDNILLKLKMENMDFLRLGRKERIHPEIYPFSEENLIKSVTNVDQLKDLYESKLVVASTCLGTNHVLFSSQRKMFDVCIIDEASQVTQLACIGPLFSAKKFILVGDSKQLPPVVQSKQAKTLGMDKSLFELLENQGITVELHLQYRMNREIMSLSNELMYNGCLKCGTDEISTQTIKKSKLDSMRKLLPLWLDETLNDDLEKSVFFMNTVKVPAPENYNSRGEVMNEIEARLVVMMVHVLLLSGINSSEIGIIAPYRNQVKIVQKTLVSMLKGQSVQNIEVNTVDQYQGRDKDIILMTFVRSHIQNKCLNSSSGEILKDDRRLNVAVTRAKKKLIFVGNVITLEQFEPLAKILSLLRNKNQIKELPAAAHSTDISKILGLET